MVLLFVLACGTDSEGCGKNAICVYNTPPSVAILQPADGATVGPLVAVEAAVEDSQTDGPALLLRWSSDVDGLLAEVTADADGLSTAELMPSLGHHRLRLEAIDTEAEMGSDEIEIEVVAP